MNVVKVIRHGNILYLCMVYLSISPYTCTFIQRFSYLLRYIVFYYLQQYDVLLVFQMAFIHQNSSNNLICSKIDINPTIFYARLYRDKYLCSVHENMKVRPLRLWAIRAMQWILNQVIEVGPLLLI